MTIRFLDPPRTSLTGFGTATGRCWGRTKVDVDGPAGQLPASGEDRELVCDPYLDPQCASIDGEISVLLARQLTALHHDRYIAPFHQLYASGFLTDEPWSPVPRADKLEQVGALVGGIPACIVRAPIGSAAEGIAHAVREELAARVPG